MTVRPVPALAPPPSPLRPVRRAAAAGIALCTALGVQAQSDPPGRAGSRAADTHKNNAAGPEFAGEGGVRQGGNQAFINRIDSTFLNDAAKMNMAELRASELAVRKAVGPQLQAFAQQLLGDHHRNDRELKSLADRKGVELPDGPTLMVVLQLKALEGAQGADFDRRYSEMVGVDAHQQAIARFETAAEHAGDEDVRAFARRWLPVLHRHLARARALAALP